MDRWSNGLARFVSGLRDPDGHCCDLLLDAAHQMLDLENEPICWNLFELHVAAGWGLPAQRTWFEEATPMRDVELSLPLNARPPLALEDFLRQKALASAQKNAAS